MANLRANRITSTEVFETTGSVQFDGSGDRLVTTLSSSPSNSAFTIESWVYFSGSTSSGNYTIFDFANATGGYGIFVKIDDGTANFRYYSDNSGTAIGSGVSVSFTSYLNTWVHIATTFDGSTYRAFFDGDLIGSFSASTEVVALNRLTIGARSDSAVTQPWLGHISNLRYIAGTALYTENFTPPTRELEVIPNTVLLACQSTTKADEEKTGKTITVNGNAVANELTPGLLTSVVKSGGSSAITGSVEFDGTGDYLNIPYNSDLWFSDQNWTIECWVHPNTFANYGAIWEHGYGAGSTIRSIVIYINQTDGLLRIAQSPDGSTNYDTSLGVSLSINSWHHLAVVRNGSTVTAYLNGIAGTSVTAYDLYNSTTRSHFIGAQGDLNATVMYNGFISNLRVIKGTALYTSNFIPPTRKLTKLPGTVLLCCQDSNDPTTEATGKTITGYGDLQKADGVELSVGTWTDSSSGTGSGSGTDSSVSITGVDLSNRGALYLSKTVEIGKQYVFSFRTTSSWGNAKFGVDSNDGTNDVIDSVSNDPDYIYITGAVASGLKYREVFTATTTTAVLYFQEADNQTSTADQISLQLYEPPNRASDFTPSVGSDDSVEFAGPTTINTENYFYLPTGPTEQRFPIGSGGVGAGTRGLVFGGYYPSAPNRSDVIDYVTIASTGDAVDFGDRLNGTDTCAACASATRALNAGGYNGSATINTIEYVTIASTGNAQDFGDLTLARRNRDGCSSSTRGLFGGGFPTDDAIEYVTIATSGNSIAFGNLTESRYNLGALASPVRGVFGGGTPSTDTMDFVTIATTADAIDFGNLTAANTNVKGTSSETRGIFGFNSNVINYITIASTGDAIDFGDLNYNPNANACTSSLIRGIFMGGGTPVIVNTISYITIASTGDAVDFGDLTQARQSLSATSSGHGGLG